MGLPFTYMNGDHDELRAITIEPARNLEHEGHAQ
jgi:hypothetical protein